MISACGARLGLPRADAVFCDHSVSTVGEFEILALVICRNFSVFCGAGKKILEILVRSDL